jgi:hypothetical protein
MNDQTIRKAFKLSFGSLHGDANIIGGALDDPIIGPRVLQHLPADFRQKFAAQTAAVAQQVVAQSGALGIVSDLTQNKAAALQPVTEYTAAARRAARLAFPGQDLLLHGEFQVGVRNHKDVSSILIRALKIHGACAAHADVLAQHGWSAAAQTSLAAAIDVLAAAAVDQSTGSDVKEGFTASRNLAANTLYKQCRTVQSVARLVYPDSKAASDPAVLEARARFLIGQFPRRRPTTADSPPPSATALAVPETATALPGSAGTLPGATIINTATAPAADFPEAATNETTAGPPPASTPATPAAATATARK